jgi:probable HAF family extracellular repeat protein
MLMTLWLTLSDRPARRSLLRRRPAFRRPRLEALEDRCLLTSYSITDIGAIVPIYGGPAYAGSGINNASIVQVVGQSAAGPGAYVWDSVHGMQQIGTVHNEARSLAFSINNAGQVVGNSWTTTEKYDRKIGFYNYKTTENGFLWSSSAGMKDLGSNVSPVGINNSGEIAGDTGSPQVASLWNGKNWTQLGILPGGNSSLASGINDFGQVVGWSNPNGIESAFLWTPSNPNGTTGSMIDLGTGYAAAINGKGQITGQAVATNGNAFLWTPSSPNGTSGTMIALGTLDPSANGGNASSWGVALNRSGVVVGASNPSGATSESQTHAVIWQQGTNGGYTLTDLNTVIASGAGWTLRWADAINDSGDIVVEATNSSFSGWYALLLTPSTTAAALAAATISTSTQSTGVIPATSTASPQVPSGSNTPLASPLPGGSSFDPAAVLASLGSVPPAAAPAGAPSPARPASPAPPPVLSPVRALPPADPADSFGPGSVSPAAARAAADQPFADLGAEPAAALFGEDLALALPR